MATEQEKFASASKAEGAFKRNPTKFHDKISLDPKATFPAEKNRYRLYVANVCPWAHRTLIMYKLKGLEDCVKLTVAQSVTNFGVAPELYHGWFFHKTDDKNSEHWEPHGFNSAADLYEHSSPGIRNYFIENKLRPSYSVPILFDEKTQKIVCNESSEIIIMFNTVFNEWAKDPELDLNPEHLREDMKKIDAIVYPKINDGVYRCGFAQTQEAYEEAYHSHWDGMDQIEKHLGENRFLTGDQITLSDIRLFTTLIRYDIAYFSKFKTSRNKIVDMPNMYRFLEEMYNYKNIASTIVQKDIVIGYYQTEAVYPLAPTLDNVFDHLKI